MTIFSNGSQSCILCSCGISRASNLCWECEMGLPYPLNPCARCGVELGPEPPLHRHCGQCLLQPPVFDVCLPLLQYEYPVRELISSFKFRAGFTEGRTLADLLANAVASYHADGDKPQLLLPVPLHKIRLCERGFNQSMELARCIGRRNDIPIATGVCRRTRATPSQKGLSALERSKNLHGAFTLNAADIPANTRHVAIVDDVVTTMSTVNCIAGLLRRVGLERIDVYCLARVSSH